MPDDERRSEVAALRDSMLGALGPLRAHIQTIEARIAELESELADLREIRRQAQRMVAIADPSGSPKPRKRTDRTTEYSEETRAKVEAAIGNNPGRDLLVADLAADTGLHPTTIAKVMHGLTAEGVVRLDRMGGARRTTKIWRLTQTTTKGE